MAKDNQRKPEIAGDPAIQALIEELNSLNLDDGPEDQVRAKRKRAAELKALIHG
jgi:hypothetical protein